MLVSSFKDTFGAVCFNKSARCYGENTWSLKAGLIGVKVATFFIAEKSVLQVYFNCPALDSILATASTIQLWMFL